MVYGREKGTPYLCPSCCATVGFFFLSLVLKCLNTGRPSGTMGAGFSARNHDQIYIGESRSPHCHYSNFIKLKIECASESSGGLVKTEIAGSEFLSQ